MNLRTEDNRIIKPYLGGWRHKITDIKYYNATTQTRPRPSRVPLDNLCTREVQTVDLKDGETQALCSRETQTWRNDICKLNTSDKYLTVRPYESYEQMFLRLDFNGKARIIQRNYRVYRLSKRLKDCAHKYRRIIEKCKEDEEKKISSRRWRFQQLIIRKTYPRMRKDFDMLYSLIDQWRSDYMKHLRLTFFRAGQLSENDFLLGQTVKMFSNISKHQQIISQERREENCARFLTINCKPIRWVGKNGKPMEMITKKIQKAREYKRVYDTLNDDFLITDERINVLMMLKKSLKAHKCLAAIELEKILDQEVLLLSRGIKQVSLNCLRKRITHYYLRFLSIFNACKCTQSCKCASETLAVEELREAVEEKSMLCRICMKITPYYKFSVHNGIRRVTCCNSCAWLRQRNTKQISYDPYVFILNCLRIDEKRRNSSSKIPFIMQEGDIYHLVNTIWHACSIVSKNKDIYCLRMVRFYMREVWSPWNCILLTEDEAEMHCEIEDLSSIYTKNIIHQISLRHLIAKNHFKYIRNLQNDTASNVSNAN